MTSPRLEVGEEDGEIPQRHERDEPGEGPEDRLHESHARFGRRKLSAVRDELAVLLGVVAQAGHAEEAEARRAYLAGMQRVLPREHRPYRPHADIVRSLDAVWEPLDALDPLAKQALVEGLVAAIGHDGRVSVAEAELLRTICAVLHCPLPPMLERT